MCAFSRKKFKNNFNSITNVNQNKYPEQKEGWAFRRNTRMKQAGCTDKSPQSFKCDVELDRPSSKELVSGQCRYKS